MIPLPRLSTGDVLFPDVDTALEEPNGLLAHGGDLEPERLIAAYSRGIFPWFSYGEPILWWSPDPRMVFATAAPHVPRRLRRWLRSCRWTIHADSAFREVMHACAMPRRDHQGTWISGAMHLAYARLHELGHAHSIEVRDGDALVGGIYGVAIGRMFFAESMFSHRDHASKVALLALCRGLAQWEFPLLDAQMRSDHLASLGGFELPRREFALQVAGLVAAPAPSGGWNGHFSAIAAADLASPIALPVANARDSALCSIAIV